MHRSDQAVCHKVRNSVTVQAAEAACAVLQLVVPVAVQQLLHHLMKHMVCFPHHAVEHNKILLLLAGTLHQRLCWRLLLLPARGLLPHCRQRQVTHLLAYKKALSNGLKLNSGTICSGSFTASTPDSTRSTAATYEVLKQ
jgi:hypothetical protein